MTLSPRQAEIARLIAEGHTNAEIAERLGINVSTVDNHRRLIYTKLNVRNAVELFEAIDAHGGRGVHVRFRTGVHMMVTVGSKPLAPTITITRTPWDFLTEDRRFA